jgi:hypothetical protein
MLRRQKYLHVKLVPPKLLEVRSHLLPMLTWKIWNCGQRLPHRLEGPAVLYFEDPATRHQ